MRPFQTALRRLRARRASRPISVLFVYRFCGLGGVETSVTTKIRALEQLGVRARALFLEYYGIGSEEIARTRGVLFGLGTEEIHALLHDEIDIVDATDFPPILDLVEAAGSGAKVIFESQCPYPPSFPAFYNRLDSPLISAIVVPSEYNRRNIREFGIQRNDIFTIPNAVDSDRFRPRAPAPSIFDRLGAHPDHPIVIFVGRLEDWKNPREFVRIAKDLASTDHVSRFVLVGDTPDFDDYSAGLKDEMGPELQQRFSFCRGVPPSQMPDVYNAARVSGGLLVSTSLHESQPMILLEAMASGCPVVSTRGGGSPEIAEDRVTARLYDLGDIAAAAEAVRDLMKPGARNAMVRSARRYVRKYHSLRRVARLYLDLFERLRTDSR